VIVLEQELRDVDAILANGKVERFAIGVVGARQRRIPGDERANGVEIAMPRAGWSDSTWWTSFGQLSKPYSRARARCAAASFTAGSTARSVPRCSLACLRSCSSEGRSGRRRDGASDTTISFRIPPASARRAERRSQMEIDV
jgi:hypothetical protein